jgi:threonine synthase
LAAVNSINWARILAQTVYYFLSYFHLQSRLPTGTNIDDIEIQYIVPTGNFGDILAGYYAKRMGLPMAKLGVATNENDILARFWKSGKYEKVDSTMNGTSDATAPVGGASDGERTAVVKETFSPAMDILVSSNFERLLWYLAFENAGAAQDSENQRWAGLDVDGWMKTMKTNGGVELPIAVLETARRDFVAERISDEEVCLIGCQPIVSLRNVEQILETIRSHFEARNSYIADPHTAVGLAAAQVISCTK